MALPNSNEIAAMTPMLRQFYELKSKAPDAILFFRMGDFYEIFGEDAEEVAPKLDIVLTSRERGDKQKIFFCGVPHHSARSYWLKLLSMGYKIAIADQMEDPSLAKGIVSRDIVKILTPGCIDDLEGLTSDCQNYILALWEDPKSREWTVAAADVSTSELRLANVKTLNDVVKEIQLFKPKEILVRNFQFALVSDALKSQIFDNQITLSPLPEAILRDEKAQKATLDKLLGGGTLDDHPCGSVSGGLVLLSAFFIYLKKLMAPTDQFMTVRPLKEPNSMNLNEIAIRDLEIFETSRRRETDGSLYRTINFTKTPMGGRLLRWTLTHPFTQASHITERHEAIESLVNLREPSINELRQRLATCADMPRIATRIQSSRVSPVELAKVKLTLVHLKEISKMMNGENPIFQEIQKHFGDTLPVLNILSQALKDEPNLLGAGSEVFRPGFDEILDQKSSLASDGESSIQRYEDELKQSTGISSLKIKNHQSFGLLIEVTKSHLSKVPDTFIRRQTMVNCERFVTLELKDLDESLSSARDQAIHRESELYQKLILELEQHLSCLYKAGDSIALLDILQCFCWLAMKYDFVRPTLNDTLGVKLIGSRHPVVENIMGRGRYVPNQLELHPLKKQLLVTGPNMAGKSTVMRQIAISSILSQIGAFVPATQANLPVFDQIFTRVGASDDLAKGQSTFMVEMAEASFILRHATDKSLVILDEVGRGTSTQDGLAIASAILNDIATRIHCWCLFATHYHELVPLAGTLNSVRLVQSEVKKTADGILFTHRLIDGASASSFGIEAAKLAGIPDHVLKKAIYFLEHSGAYQSLTSIDSGNSLAQTNNSLEFTKQVTTPEQAPEPVRSRQSDTNDHEDQVSEILLKLETLNINRTTPLQALNHLSDLKELLQQKGKKRPIGLFDIPMQ